MKRFGPCLATPNKVRYPTSSLAWHVGARQLKKTDTTLYLYRCPSCSAWHLTSRPLPGSVRIETKAANEIERQAG